MANFRKTPAPDEHSRRHEWLALGLLCFGVFLSIGFFSYDPHDLRFYSTAPNNPPVNIGGLVGSYLTFVFLFLYGFASFLTPFYLAALIIQLFRGIDFSRWLSWFFYFQLALVSASVLLSMSPTEGMSQAARHYQIISPGGLLGAVFGREVLLPYMGKAGSLFLCTLFLAVSLKGIYDFSLLKLTARICTFLKNSLFWLIGKASRGALQALTWSRKQWIKRRKRIPAIRPSRLESTKAEVTALRIEENAPAPSANEPPAPRKPRVAAPKVIEPPLPVRTGNIVFPGLELLQDPPGETLDLEENLKANAQRLVQTLAEFDIEAEVTGIESGPVITRYEIQIASGIKVQRVTSLDNDIALAMRAKSVRIIAPIPGKAAIGVEIPNQIRKTVTLKELIHSEEMRKSNCVIPLLLGKNISGRPVIADLTRMPHLLIAGATGSGKSVCINSLVISMLYTLSPEDVKVMMVDPKKVELATYKNLPHLFVPLITNPSKVSRGLRSLLDEMDHRYSLFKEVGVRNLEGYNKKEKSGVRKHLAAIKPDEDPETLIPDKLPYIIVIIDELADLMMVAKAEVESNIVRLAQLSRAVGMHLILATQRPSVDVVTGLIKANIPARIAFRVSAKVDSRTVLDTGGAEKLLGHGDMLLLDPSHGGELQRIQGAYLDDNEIHRVVTHWESQCAPQYDLNALDAINQPETGQDQESDPLFDEVLVAIQESANASTSFLQRRFRIGYNRASRIMDELEMRGVIGPPTSGKSREIYLEPSDKKF